MKTFRFAPPSLCLWVLLTVGKNHLFVAARGRGGGGGGSRPSPSKPSPSPPRPSPAYPSTPNNYPSPAYPTTPNHQPTPYLIPTSPSHYRPNHHPHGSNTRQDCYEREVNVTDSTTNVTETTTEVVCTTVRRGSSSSSGGVSGGAIAGIALVVLLVGIAVIVGCIWYSKNNNNTSYLPTTVPVAPTNGEEPAAWAKIRQQVQDDAAGTLNGEFALVKPTNGVFEATYEEDGRTLSMTVHLRFVEDKTGWTLQGNGQDADGNFALLEGLLSPTGVVYWIEKCSEGKALTEGRFSADGTEMEGTWQADNGVSGSYQNFRLIAASASDTEMSEDGVEPVIAVPVGDSINNSEEPEIAVVKVDDEPEIAVK